MAYWLVIVGRWELAGHDLQFFTNLPVHKWRMNPSSLRKKTFLVFVVCKEKLYIGN
jgi:hypothetical protein